MGRDRTYDQLINSQLHYRCATMEYISAAYDIQRDTIVITDWVTDALNRNDTDLRQVLAVLWGNDPHLQQ
jgi:hypothetical protein